MAFSKIEKPITSARMEWDVRHVVFCRISFSPKTSDLRLINCRGEGARQGCFFRLPCSHPVLTEDHVLTSACVKFFRTVTRNAVNKGVWRKKDCPWPPLNKYAMNVWLSSLRIRAHLSWRTGKHLHVLHVLRTYSTCSYPGYCTRIPQFMQPGHHLIDPQ